MMSFCIIYFPILTKPMETVATCESFMIAMVLFPDVQRKAQAELDRVVGDSRLPDYDDMPNLPYIRAIVMEALRWMPILPFGIPHTCTADSTYKGYHIPKGAMCIPVRVLKLLFDRRTY